MKKRLMLEGGERSGESASVCDDIELKIKAEMKHSKYVVIPLYMFEPMIFTLYQLKHAQEIQRDSCEL